MHITMPQEKKLHLAIIPDGNRRWARNKALQPWKGHESAIEVIRRIIEWCRENPQIGILTLWLFSTENWKRNPEEIGKLMEMLRTYLIEERPNFHRNETRFVHSGKKERIPEDLATLIRDMEEETAAYGTHTLHLALDYGGRDEIVRAVQRLGAGEEVSEEKIRAHLDHPELPDIDIIVRTSGEQRVSNFFLWQGAYAEWFFVDKLFPDLTTQDIGAIIEQFTKRSRRFGG